MGVQSTSEDKTYCRFCRQAVHPQALKCQHCGEMLSTRSRFEKNSKKLASFIGLTMALLSLFYAMQEGYYYIQDQRQNREALKAYISATEHFIELDNLDYAQSALKQAIEIDPNNKQLLLRHFFLSADAILREADYFAYQLPDHYVKHLPELITSGFSLLQHQHTNTIRAKMLVFLGRLLNYDQKWQDAKAIHQLFYEAYQLTPNNSEVQFWYAQWLANHDDDFLQALPLLKQITQQHPDNPMYWKGLGETQLELESYANAFNSFKKAIELGPSQNNLQRIRAANESKRSLRVALIKADQALNIASSEFDGLTIEQRHQLIEYLKTYYENSKSLLFLSAKLHAVTPQGLHKAEGIMQELLVNANYNYANIEYLKLYAEILNQTGTQPETLAKIEKQLAGTP